MRSLRLLPALLLAACAGCSANAADPPPASPTPTDADVARSSLQRDRSPQADDAAVAQAARDNNAFSTALYRRLAAGRGAGDNLFFSGYSVSSAFAMLQAGARGETAAEITRTLRFSLPPEKLAPAMNRLALALESRAASGGRGSDGKGFRLAMSNTFWGERGTKWEAPFLDTLAQHYDAGIHLVSFQRDPDGARVSINAWAERQTEGRVKELLSPLDVTSETQFVLANTVYFNAAWAEPFATATLAFKDGATESTVPAIAHTSHYLKYAEVDGTSVVAIPYEGHALEMVVVVPRSLAAFEAGLDDAKLTELLDRPVAGYVTLTMPKLTIAGASFKLRPELEALGLSSLFGNADLGGVTTERRLRVDDVVHQAFLKVNEDGTEAAAATTIIGVPASAELEPPKRVDVDRPYAFFIRDVPTKQILFTGRVTRPSYVE